MLGFQRLTGSVVSVAYIQRANRENFLYDLRCVDGESMQYTRYGEGQFYGWHNDAGALLHNTNLWLLVIVLMVWDKTL